jgi:hypothetical protein
MTNIKPTYFNFKFRTEFFCLFMNTWSLCMCISCRTPDGGCKLVPKQDKGPFEGEVNGIGIQQDPNQSLEGPKA